MGFFYFIKQYNGIGLTAHFLSKLTAFLIPHISRRRSNKARDSKFLHIFTHVYPNQSIGRAKHIFCQFFGKMCFTNSRRAQKHKGSDWFIRILEPDATSQNCFNQLFYSRILGNDFRLKGFFHSSQLHSFGLCHSLYRYTRHHRNNIGYFFSIHRFPIIF